MIKRKSMWFVACATLVMSAAVIAHAEQKAAPRVAEEIKEAVAVAEKPVKKVSSVKKFRATITEEDSGTWNPTTNICIDSDGRATGANGLGAICIRSNQLGASMAIRAAGEPFVDEKGALVTYKAWMEDGTVKVGAYEVEKAGKNGDILSVVGPENSVQFFLMIFAADRVEITTYLATGREQTFTYTEVRNLVNKTMRVKV